MSTRLVSTVSVRLVTTVCLIASIACGGSESTPGSSPSAGGGSRDCAAIESEYFAAAIGSSSTACSGPGGNPCGVQYGLCKTSGALVRGNAKGVYNAATTAKLDTLDA